MRHSWELTVPADIVEDAMEELSQGVRITIESSVRLWREKRMSASELESLLHSVAWQSPTLTMMALSRRACLLALSSRGG